LYTFGDQWDENDLEGMLQLHHLTSTRSGIPIESINDTNISMWKHIREVADQDGDEDCAVVLVQFVNNFKQAITCPVIVGQEAISSARRAKPFTSCSALTGKETDHPLSIASCFEYMNTHIRSDRGNRLLLRAPMRESDKALIREAGQKTGSYSPQAQSLRVKVQREGVYVSHRVVLPAGGAVGLARDPLPFERQVERGHIQEGQAPSDAPPRNRAERRRLEQELKKQQKRKK